MGLGFPADGLPPAEFPLNSQNSAGLWETPAGNSSGDMAWGADSRRENKKLYSDKEGRIRLSSMTKTRSTGVCPLLSL